MDNSRTDSARDHDDHQLIDGAEADAGPASGAVGISADVNGEQDIAAIAEPDTRTRVRKAHDQHHDQAWNSGQPRGVD